MAIFSAIAAVGTAIGSAISAVGTFIGGLGTIGSFLLKTAVGVGLNLLAQSLAGKPQKPTFSINGTLRSGGAVPRSFFFGRTATAGSLVWVNTWGKSGDTPNAYLTQVIAISDLPVTSLDEVWVNGEKVTLGTTADDGGKGYPVTEYNKGGDNLWIKFYDGTQTTADSFLTGTASNSQRTWESTRVGVGVAYAIVTARVTKNMFSGIPTFKFVVSGTKLYDITKDSTEGGTGTHRWGDPSTWGGDGDSLPAVQAYNLLRGITYNDKWFYGLQALSSSKRLPAANWIAQINKCRGSGTTPVYRSAGEVTVDAPLSAALEAILTACQGRIAEVGGVYTIYVGEPDDPVVSFTDGDILSTEEQSFTPFFGLADTINGIAATYPSPEDGWAEKSAPPLYRTDLEALAGNRRLMADVTMTFVPYPEQVQRLMKSSLAEAQRARRHTIVLPPKFWPYAVPGAVLSWTSERNGYEAKSFRIDGAADRANLDVMVDITEVDPSDFDWDSDTDYTEPVDGAVGVIRPGAQALVGVQVFPATLGVDGSQLPSIKVSYPGDLDDVRAVRVQVRLDGETDVMFDGEIPYGDPRTNANPSAVVLQGTFAPDTDYEVRCILVPYGDRDADWSDWLDVTTPNVWISDTFPVDLDRLEDDVKGYLDFVGSGLRDHVRRLEEIDLWIADQDFGNEYDRQQIRQHMSAEFADVRATYDSKVDVLTAADLALASQITTLTATVGTKADASTVSALSAEVHDSETGLIANANAITALDSAVDGFSASGLFRVETVATETGASATIGLSAAATAEGVTEQAALFVSALTGGGSRISMLAAETMILDSQGNLLALFDEDSGTVYLDSIKVRWADIDGVSIGTADIDDAAITSPKIFDLEVTRLAA